MDEVKGLTRKERAERTRRAIVAAATEEFRASGYHGTTMAAIAKRAGVAVQTVYFVVHTKPLLLTAAIDAAVMGDEDPGPPELTDWWQEGTSTTVGRRAIELFVTNVAAIEQRAAVLDRVADAAASTDPEVAVVTAHHETMRRDGFSAYLATFPERGLLRKGLELDEAVDVLLTMVGSKVFLEFTMGRGWSVQRWSDWTTDTLCALLLEPGRRRSS